MSSMTLRSTVEDHVTTSILHENNFKRQLCFRSRTKSGLLRMQEDSGFILLGGNDRPQQLESLSTQGFSARSKKPPM